MPNAKTNNPTNQESGKALTTRMHDSMVYAGGTLTYYVAGPLVGYIGEPLVKYAAVPAVAVAGAAIATLPVAAPITFGMLVTAGVAIPRVMNYSVSTTQARTREFGEAATAKLLDGSKTAITFLYNSATELAGGLYNRIVNSNPVAAKPLYNEGEFEIVEGNEQNLTFRTVRHTA
jgi:hypothetical protein